MKQQNYSKLLLLVMLCFTLFFSLSSFVSASANSYYVNYVSGTGDSFSASLSSVSASACKCATDISYLSISNTGMFSSRYTITTHSKKISFSESFVEVQPGQTGVIIVYNKVSCNDGGKDNFDIIINSSYGAQKILTQDVKYLTCQNLKTGLITPSHNQSACIPFTDTIRIENTGSFADEYFITINSFKDYARLSAENISLLPGSYKDVSVGYDLPCDVYGNYTLGYKVATKKSKLVANFSQELTIPKDSYNFTISIEDNFSVCAFKESTKYLLIKNNNNFSNDFFIDAIIPSYVTVKYPIIDGKESNVITLNPHSATKIPLVFSAKDDSIGFQDKIFITVNSRYGKVTKSVKASVFVDNCYDTTTLLLDDNLYRCTGDSFSLPVTLVNNGVKSSLVELELLAPDFMHLVGTKDNYVFVSNKSVISIDGVIPSNVSTKYPITLNSYIAGRLVSQNSFDLYIQDVSKCYAVQSELEKQRIKFYEKTISFEVENKGTREGTYFIELTNTPDFITFGGNITLIKKNQESSFSAPINANKLKEYFASQGITTLIGQSFTPEIRVTNLDSGEVYLQSTVIKFVDDSLCTKVLAWFWGLLCCFKVLIILMLLTILFFIIFIVRLFQKRVWKGKKVLGLILLVIIILSTIAVLWYYGLPTKSDYLTTPDLSSGLPNHIRILEGGITSVNISNYFFDPDGDIDVYGVSNIDTAVLSYTLNNSTLTLQPKPNWFGNTTIQFFVVDSYGKKASSSGLFVDVLPVKHYTLKQWAGFLCVYINWLLLVLLAVFIFVSCSLKRPKKDKPVLVQEVKKQPIKSSKKDISKNVSTKNVSVKNVSTRKKAVNKVSLKKPLVKKNPIKKAVSKSSKKDS